jgi:hypothetical protein
MKTVTIISICILILIPNIYSSDKEIKIIENYYSYLSHKDNLKKAYEISSKKVSFETFSSWYENTLRTEISNIKSQDDGSYQVFVTILDNNPKDENKINCAVYDVTLWIKNDQIEKSISKQVFDYIYYSKKIDNNYKIEVSDDTKNSQFVLKIISIENGKPIFSKNYQYNDEFRNNFKFKKKINDFVFIEISGFEWGFIDIINLKNKKVITPDFWNLTFSSDDKVVISYANDDFPDTTQGLILLIYDNKYINLSITDTGVTEPKIEINNGEYFITFKEYQKGDTTKFLGNKKINISKLLIKK